MPSFPTDIDYDAGVHRQEFADHVILNPPNRLKQRAAKIVDAKGREDADPVRRAENALQLLSNEFDSWMAIEIDALEVARSASIGAGGIADLSALYRVLHDIRGQAATFGFPLVGVVADGLCGLMERPGKQLPPQSLIDLHVDSIRAMVREDVRERDNPLGAALVQRLARLRQDAVSAAG